MSSIDNIRDIEVLGDAVPFVGRIREIIEVIKLFEDFEASELDGLARYMRCYRAPLGAEIIQEGDTGDFDRESLSRIIAEEPRIGVKLMMELLMLLNQRLRSVSSQLLDCVEARRSRIR